MQGRKVNKDWQPNVRSHHNHHSSSHLSSNGLNFNDNLRFYHWNDTELWNATFFRTIPSFMRIQDNPLPPAPPHPGSVIILYHLFHPVFLSQSTLTPNWRRKKQINEYLFIQDKCCLFQYQSRTAKHPQVTNHQLHLILIQKRSLTSFKNAMLSYK